MLKRIQNIKTVGCFSDTHPARMQFERLTFIYGENCYGKTTLCDIFRSLAENDPQSLTARVSVPNPDNQPQLVQLGFSMPNEKHETILTFNGHEWNPELPSSIRILVFDTDFIHRNVFTGLSIERENQENLTEFIIGESSVSKARDIAKLNSHLRAVNKEIRQLKSDVFEGLEDIEDFVALEVKETKEKIQKRISFLLERIAMQKDLRANLAKAIARNNPSPIDLPEDFTAFVKHVNDCFMSIYERVHIDAAERVHQHIEKKTKALRTTQQWLQHGLDHMLVNECPFCGQRLYAQAQELLSSYRDFFDEAFEHFVSETSAILDKIPDDFNQFQCVDLLQNIRENESCLAEYDELANDTEYESTVNQLTRRASELVESWRLWQTIHAESSRELSTSIKLKRAALHTRAESWECKEAIAAYGRLIELLSSYNELVRQLVEQIAEFKGGLNSDDIEEKIALMVRQREEQLLKHRRLQSSDACSRYSKHTQDKAVTEEAIGELRDELYKEQEEFLDNYFEAINNIFAKLGSGPFRISKVDTQRGNMPVVRFSASYSGVPITSDRLRYFFSESDRRALALSIFWAKVDLLTEQEKAVTILILDDPVTSFDDGRVDRTIRLMDSVRTSFRQVIVLSHYPNFLKSFFDRAHLQARDIRIARLLKTDKGSQLEISFPAYFVESEHQAKFRHIVDFIERRHREDICQDLRVYLETELRSRYRKQIAENNLEGIAFSDLCNALRDSSYISKELRDEIEQYILSLNPDHHIWTGRSHEDKVSLASDILNFIYASL